ncbi:MAG: cation diffusion facilitator family transporter [Deltaproteobacteria bacterium]|nr:cation diffusion facilitator family transporter [Deltaproteobacteria bacterium]
MADDRQDGKRDGQRITWIGVLANSFLIVLKFLAGIYGHSQAMIADAVHSVSDFITDAVVLVGLAAGRAAPDDRHPFGHGKIETLSSTVVGLALLAVAVFLGVESGSDIYHHRQTNPTWLALAGAAVSILIKEILYQYTVIVGRRIKSPAVVANAWHHRSDALSSVAVFIGLLGAQIRPEWHILDAYAALVVSFFIFKVGVDVLWASLKEIVDTAPDSETQAHIENCITSVSGVMEYHDLKVRSSGGLLQIQVHVLVNGGLTVAQGHEIAKNVEHCILDRVEDSGQVLVHVDPDHPTGLDHAPPDHED